MLRFDLNAIVNGAKAKKAVPYKTTVHSEAEGIELADST